MAYIGQQPDSIRNEVKNRYFYGLRRTHDGELFLGKVDSMDPNGSIQINKPGVNSNDYDNFEKGADFFEGRDIEHNLLYENLNYEQYRFDDANLWYYIDSEGELVVSVNRQATYDDGSSSHGIG